MSLLKSLFGAGNSATTRIRTSGFEDAVARWGEIASADLRAPLATQRWLVVDVETTGLNMKRDRLLAIGAVQIEGAGISLQKSFEVVLKQATPSDTDNILIHRIPGGEQLEGVDAASGLLAFMEYAGKMPCVAFHAPFDETMLKRAFDEYLGVDFSPPFIDLAWLAPALCQKASRKLQSLDDWLAYFSITISARHHAVADALGTAQLFQVLLQRAAAHNIDTAASLFKIAEDQRWLSKARR